MITRHMTQKEENKICDFTPNIVAGVKHLERIECFPTNPNSRMVDTYQCIISDDENKGCYYRCLGRNMCNAAL